MQSFDVNVVGGGLAGASAAVAVRRLGGAVRVFEETRFPRNRVCGEFLSPEAGMVMDSLGLMPQFLALHPHPIRRMSITLGGRTATAQLSETAFGISRYQLDHFLLEQARLSGAVIEYQRMEPGLLPGPVVVAVGRRGAGSAPGERLFGFKTYFRGPGDDSVNLFFFAGAYVGVSGVEDGRLNVCGLAPESALQAVAFEVEDFLRRSGLLWDLLASRERLTKWLFTGPVAFRKAPMRAAGSRQYRAGDALSFIDPFTGSGMLNAMLTGKLAGEAALRGDTPESFLRTAHRAQRTQFLAAAALRHSSRQSWVAPLVPWLPLRAVFAATRPRMSSLRN